MLLGGEGEGDTVPVKRALKRRDTPDQERARGSSMGTGFEFIRDGDWNRAEVGGISTSFLSSYSLLVPVGVANYFIQ